MAQKQLSINDLRFSPIRRVIVDEVEYFSLVDIMAEFSDLNSDPRILWNRTKKRLIEDKSSVVSKVIQLKMQSGDGKNYLTDCADGKTVLRIIQSIPSEKAEPIKEWLAELGYRELQDRAARKRKATIEQHERAGYGDHPEVQRLKDRDANIDTFRALKSAIAKVCDDPNWGRLINAEYMAMFRHTAKMIETIIGAKGVRDNLPSVQLTALTHGERMLQLFLRQHDKMSNDQIEQAIYRILEPIGAHVREICELMNIHPLSGKSLLE